MSEILMPQSKKHNASFNAMRGLAALGIFFSHMSYLKASDMPFWSSIYQFFMRHGSVCSSFFYILSGFLAVYTWKNATFKDYILKKLKKLYPLVLSVLFLAIILDFIMSGSTVISDIVIGSGQWWFNILMGITMLKAFVPLESTFYSFHGPSWYMTALIVFYVLAWFIVPKLTNSKNNKQQKFVMRLITLICISAYVIQAIICLIVDIKGLSNIRLWITYVNPWFRIFGECFLGMVIACYIDKIKLTKNSGDRLKVIALLFTIAMLMLRNVIKSSFWNAWVFAFPIASLVIAFYDDKGRVANVLHTKPFQFLGKISFELYMTHAFVYEGLPIAIGILSSSMKNWLIYHAGTRFMITLLCSILFAWIVNWIFKFIGKKFLHFDC